MVALGDALVSRGHTVTLVNMSEVSAMMPRSRVRFAALDHPGDQPGLLNEHFQKLARPSGFVGLPQMIRSTASMTKLLLDALPSRLRQLGVDAVIADSVEPAGSLVARYLDLPFITAVTGLPMLREENVPPPFLGWAYRSDAVGRNRNAGGYAISDLLLRPISKTIASYARRWGLDADQRHQWSQILQVAQCPAGLDFPRTETPSSFRYGGPWRLNEPADRPVDKDGRPLIYCSLGSLQGQRRGLFSTMTRACAAVGARAIVAHGGGLSHAEASALPGNPIVRAFWAQSSVLPLCSAAILHGGFNTVLDALAAGVPIIAVPLGFEQPATAARLKRTGAGRIVSPRAVSHRTLVSTLHQVLSEPSYRTAAQRLGDEIRRSGGVAEAASAVEAAFSIAPLVIRPVAVRTEREVAYAA